MFEVQDLRFATLATVSRCGMVWFSEDVLSLDMIFEHFLTRMRNISIDEGEEEVRGRLQIGKRASTSKDDTVSPTLQVRMADGCSCHYCACMNTAVMTTLYRPAI